MVLPGDIGLQRSICSGCRKAGVQCNTALRIRVEGSRTTQRWNHTVPESESPLTQATSSDLGIIPGRPSRVDSRTAKEANSATVSDERSPEGPSRHPSSQDASSTAQARAPHSSIRTAEGSTGYHTYPERPAGDSFLTNSNQDPSSDNSHIRTNAYKLDNTGLRVALTDTLSPSLESQRSGPCLFPIGEAESCLIKYFFNVLAAWVSQSLPRREMLICSSCLIHFGSLWCILV